MPNCPTCGAPCRIISSTDDDTKECTNFYRPDAVAVEDLERVVERIRELAGHGPDEDVLIETELDLAGHWVQELIDQARGGGDG